VQWFGVSPSEFRTLSIEGRHMQITKYWKDVNQLSTDWNDKNVEKQVDAAFRLNEAVNKAKLQASKEDGSYYSDLENIGIMDVRPRSFINRIGHFVLGNNGRILSTIRRYLRLQGSHS
jgi:hypothetical protein